MTVSSLRKFAVLASTALAAAAAPSAHAIIVLSQARLGNIFLTTETVQIPLTCNGDEITWSATDYFGATVKRGRVVPTNGSATITPNLGRRGYFELEMIEKKSGAVLSRKETTFAVLKPFDASAVGANSPFGAQTHFAQFLSTEPLTLLARAGIKHIRDEHYWQTLERTRSQFTYPQHYTHFMQAASDAGISPLLILGWGHPLYDYVNGELTVPYTESGRQGYANYALNLANRYGNQLDSLEVWNEFNAGTFVAGPATANKPYYYSLLLKKVYETVKPRNPGTTLLAGGTVPIAHGFLRSLFSHGAMPYFDAVSVHPYRGFPSGVEIELAELRELIKSYNNGVEKPIWASEFSMSVDTPEEQHEGAAYLAQIVPLMLSQKMERMYYYLTTDDPVFPHRGLVSSFDDPRGEYTPHPTYVVYATLIRQLTGATFHSRYANLPSATYALRFQQSGTPVHVLWSMQPASLRLFTSSNVTVVDIMGQQRTLSPNNGVIALPVTENPQFVRGPINAIKEVGTKLFADSVSGYSKTQGQNGWYYGTAYVLPDTAYNPAQFQPMSWQIWTTYNYRWVGGNVYNFVTGNQMHPTWRWSIRRWVSDKTSTVTLSGKASVEDKRSNGVVIRIFLDGRQVYSRTIMPSEAITYRVPNIAIAQGSILDFVVDANGSSGYDATEFTAMVTKQ